MSKRKMSRTGSVRVAAGAVVGGLVLAAPADAAPVCHAIGGTNQLPAGSSACLTVDLVPGHVDQVQRAHVDLTVPGYFTYQVVGDDPRFPNAALPTLISARYTGGTGVGQFVNVSRDFCNVYSGRVAFDWADACGSYPANSKIELRVYRDNGTTYAGASKITINPTAPVCTWKC